MFLQRGIARGELRGHYGLKKLNKKASKISEK
jgi:hypothetical protein